MSGDAKPAKLKTFRTNNGSVMQAEVAPAQPLRCPEDHRWLQGVLASHNFKAFSPQTSVTDPKQRRSANELHDYCAGDHMKLWSATDRGPVESLQAYDGVRPRKLVSVPTGMLPAM